jgi:hypothetical protein
MRGLHQLCVGSKGTLVPLSVLPMEGAIPQIVSLPPAAKEDTEAGGYYVAYTTVPQAREPALCKRERARARLRVMGAGRPAGRGGAVAVHLRAGRMLSPCPFSLPPTHTP